MDWEQLAISVLARGQCDLAVRFATQGADKFGPGGFAAEPCASPSGVRDPLHYPAGDHVVLLGTVVEARSTVHCPLVYHSGTFPELVTGDPGETR